MRHRLCNVPSGFAILLAATTLGTVAVRTALPADPSSSFGTTQPAPGHRPPATAAPGTASPNQLAVAPASAPASNVEAILPDPVKDIRDEQIGAAITRGVDFLLSNFDKSELKHLEGEANEVDHDGLTALCLYALLQAGQATHDPRLNVRDPFIKAVIDQLKRQKLESTGETQSPVVYARSLRAAALAVCNRPEDRSALRSDVEWLIRNHREGAYTYDDKFGTPTEIVVPTPANSGPRVIVAGPGGSPPPTVVAPGPGGSKMPIKPSLAPSKIPNLAPSRLPNLNPSPMPNLNPSRYNGWWLNWAPGPHTGPRRDQGGGGGGAPSTRPASSRPTLPAYPQRPPGSRSPASPNAIPEPLPFPWDNSNSQFGLLGVWAGAEADIEVPKRYWEAVEGHWLRDEQEGGQWGYSDYHVTPSFSMNCAGIASLLVTHDWIGPQNKDSQPKSRVVAWPSYNRGLEAGLNWLMTSDNSVAFKDAGTYYVGYNLFGIERIGLASGFKYFGRHDWYRELSATVVPVQWPNGAFGKSFEGYDTVVQSAFTILFLSRGRHPVMMEKLWFTGAWANRPRDIANVTRFASQQLERPLNWQVVPIDHEWTDWLDSPVLYVASDKPPILTDQQIDKLRSYAQAGNVIFTHADGAAEAFNTYVEKTLAPKLSPKYEMQDVPANDPIYTVQYRLKAPVPKLRGVSNGSRWLLIHSPADLGVNWQMRSDNQPNARPSFELAVNLFVYAAGKSDLRNRLASNFIPPATSESSKRITVARLSYAGNWDPEPFAWERTSRWIQQNADRKLDVKTLAVNELTPASATLAILTGSDAYAPTEAEIASLKSFVESGGWLLIDDCGGTGKFAASVEREMIAKLTSEKLQPIAAGDSRLAGDLAKPKYREGTTERTGASYKPMSVTIGKGRIIYSPVDFTTGLLGANTYGVLGYQPTSAMSFVKNVLLLRESQK